MNRVVEAALFGSVALALHAGAFLASSQGGAAPSGTGDRPPADFATHPDIAPLVASWGASPVAASVAPASPTAPAPRPPDTAPRAPARGGGIPAIGMARQGPPVAPAPPSAQSPVPSLPQPEGPFDPQAVSDILTPPEFADLVGLRPRARPAPSPGSVPVRSAAQDAPATGSVRAGDRGGVAVSRSEAGGSASAPRDVGGPRSSAATPAQMRDWARQVTARISRVRRPPPGDWIDGTTVLAVRLSRDGALRRIDLVQSSGDPRLDAAAVATVRAAAPFPAGPEAAPEEMRFDTPLTFKR